MNNNQWWGYIHSNGSIQVKRALWDIEDTLNEAYDSPFCVRIFSPFEANSREEAIEIIKKQL